jgi:Virulence factor BrkB
MRVLTGIALVYHLAPAVRQRWRWITLGSVLAVTLWLVASMGLRLYLMYFDNYAATYGSIGGVILLLLWLYLTASPCCSGPTRRSSAPPPSARYRPPDTRRTEPPDLVLRFVADDIGWQYCLRMTGHTAPQTYHA